MRSRLSRSPEPQVSRDLALTNPPERSLSRNGVYSSFITLPTLCQLNLSSLDIFAETLSVGELSDDVVLYYCFRSLGDRLHTGTGASLGGWRPARPVSGPHTRADRSFVKKDESFWGSSGRMYDKSFVEAYLSSVSSPL